MSRRPSATRIWGGPILLGVLSALGLVAALLADGAGDVVSWLTLAVPVATVGWFGLRRA